MSRRIVFAGSAQTRALARIYRSEVAAHTGDDVIFIGAGAVGTDAARSTLLMADLVAMEIDEDGDAIPHEGLPSQASVVRIPNLYCDYLWPFAGRAHPRNRGAFALPGGPYPSEHGDRYLDQMVADGVAETTAIVRYKAMDIATEGELDSRLTDRSAILTRLDGAAGYDLAPFIAERFRTEPLFRTRQRLTRPLLARLVDQLFAKLGVVGWREDSLRRVPFPAGAQPLHPGVIAHFGLGWAKAGDRYPVNEEGFFTFEEFCRRYMGFVWNETLHRGIQTAKTNPAAALADLEQGLAESPGSPLGKLALIVARHAADPTGGPADPSIVIDEDSYDATAAPAAGMETAPIEFEAVQSGPEEALLAEAAPEMPEAAEGAADDWPPVLAEDASIDEAGLFDAPAEDELIGEAAPAPPPAPVERSAARVEAGASRSVLRTDRETPKPGSIADGFTDFRPMEAQVPAMAMAVAGNDLIDALPSLLPVFADLASTVDRPFGTMPEVMPPPPLRPILPPELQDEGPRPGLFARMLGRK